MKTAEKALRDISVLKKRSNHRAAEPVGKKRRSDSRSSRSTTPIAAEQQFSKVWLRIIVTCQSQQSRKVLLRYLKPSASDKRPTRIFPRRENLKPKAKFVCVLCKDLKIETPAVGSGRNLRAKLPGSRLFFVIFRKKNAILTSFRLQCFALFWAIWKNWSLRFGNLLTKLIFAASSVNYILA